MGFFFGAGVIRSWRVRIRAIVAREGGDIWAWLRCQAMVSGPASCPAVTSRSRSVRTAAVRSLVVAVGEVWGRRERGSYAAWPSVR